MMLNQQQIEVYIKEHLPYRLNGLMAYDIGIARQADWNNLIGKQNPYADSLFLEPTFEFSLLIGRALIEFLGIKYVPASDSFDHVTRPRTDDILVTELFPSRSYCQLNHPIILNNSQSIKALMITANKSVAHLTTEFSSSAVQELFADARKAIYELVLDNIPEIDRTKLWYDVQILNR